MADMLESVYHAYVKLTAEQKGIPPTMKQVAREVGLRAQSNVYHYVRILVEQKRLEPVARGNRNIYRLPQGIWKEA